MVGNFPFILVVASDHVHLNPPKTCGSHLSKGPLVYFSQAHLNLKDETLHLTAKLIDKFQLKYPVELDRFQLIGVGCLLLAAKYEERFAPEVS